MACSSAVKRFHNVLIGRIGSVIGRVVSLIEPGDEWERAAAETTLSFDLKSTGSTTAERKVGNRCVVFPLNDESTTLDCRVWGGWHEEWKCRSRNNFELIGASWTFYWGWDGRLGKGQQIFRGEWDQIAHRGRNVAQPHWHIDTPEVVGYTRRPSSGALVSPKAEYLDELPTDSGAVALKELGVVRGLQEIDLSGMHLGMGGWQNHERHPECWQVQVNDRFDDLVLWAERTLRCSRDQFEELRLGSVVE